MASHDYDLVIIGAVVPGPATEGLTTYEVEETAGEVRVRA